MFPLLVVASLLAAPSAKPAVNTKCPPCGGGVTAKSPKVTVRGQEYYVCCTHCGASLEKEPDKYLEKDGVPKKR